MANATTEKNGRRAEKITAQKSNAICSFAQKKNTFGICNICDNFFIRIHFTHTNTKRANRRIKGGAVISYLYRRTGGCSCLFNNKINKAIIIGFMNLILIDKTTRLVEI